MAVIYITINDIARLLSGNTIYIDDLGVTIKFQEKETESHADQT